MGAKHAKWFVRSAETTGWLRETELVPKTQGHRLGDQADGLRPQAGAGKERCRRRSRRTSRRTSGEARALRELTQAQGREGAAGIVQGEHALGRIEFTEEAGVRENAPEIQPGVEPPHAEG